MHACMLACLLACMLACLLACMLACLHAFMLACLLALEMRMAGEDEKREKNTAAGEKETNLTINTEVS